MIPETSRKDIKKIKLPRPNSHKWQNGSVLVIGGSHRYHGAPLFAVQSAARFVDIVHFACEENYKAILPSMRGKLLEFIPVFSRELTTYINHVDVVLIGPGLELTKKNRKLVRWLLKKFPDKKIVLDAGALRLMDLSMLSKCHILTPNVKEFKDVFKTKRTLVNTQALAKKLGATIVAKGPNTYIASQTRAAINTNGNAGLTKGGTGDVLAGLIAAFYARNDAFASTSAACFLVGKTAELLWKKRKFAFSASDVLGAIPETFGTLHRP